MAGCSSPTPGNATPSTSAPADSVPATSVSSDAGQVPGPGVPKVQNPIDTAQVAKNPCSSLTDDQANGLFGGPLPGDPDLHSPAGPACNWDGGSAHGYARVGVIVTNVAPQGLTSVYASKGTSYKYFQPLAPVGGYPAVAYDVSAERSPGECNMAVGISDTQVIDIAVRQQKSRIGSKEPCVSAQEVAVMVIGNIRGGQ
ncbi:DUF3558 domain-containing protein [Amycolatopsis panacis]|uniref:DUF3558 domain-containing protein n=1 Tax=Amycolatopsis panacis TaxID=2340917 RepID=A0A419I7D0_9PSEU|nr:DUF3558 domain-containing protein [Amycolatopsis panacis]